MSDNSLSATVLLEHLLWVLRLRRRPLAMRYLPDFPFKVLKAVLVPVLYRAAESVFQQKTKAYQFKSYQRKPRTRSKWGNQSRKTYDNQYDSDGFL
jgi:hypothetical protein